VPRKHAFAQFPSLPFWIDIRGVAHVERIRAPTPFGEIFEAFVQLFLVLDLVVLDDVGQRAEDVVSVLHSGGQLRINLLVNRRLLRAVVDEVQHIHPIAPLSEPLDAADALFQP